MANFCTRCGNPIDRCTCNFTQTAGAQTQGRSGGFCTRCGNPLDRCTCNFTQTADTQSAWNQTAGNQTRRPGGFCTRCGKPLAECTCGTARVSAPQNVMSIKDFFGFSESDNLKKEDCFEIGKKIVPQIVKPGDGEIPIKQYDIGRARRRTNFSWGFSRIQITNKRIIQRTVGRSIIGKDIQHQEFAIDDIAGFEFNKGKQFSIGDFFIVLIIALVSLVISGLIGSIAYIIGLLFSFAAIMAWIYVRFIQRKSSNVFFTCLSAFGAGAAAGGTLKAGSEGAIIIAGFLASVALITAIVYLIRSSLLPSVSVAVKTRVFPGDGARVSAGMRVTEFKSRAIILPGKDAEQSLTEIGAIISDIQKLGDYAIQKWSDNPANSAQSYSAQ